MSTVTTMPARSPWWLRLGEIVRAMIGAPSYDQYIAHMRMRHPERAPLTRPEFIQARLHERYDKPGARCC